MTGSGLYDLYDNAGTTFEVPPHFYEEAIALAPRYVHDAEKLESLVRDINARKERCLPQHQFNLVCDVLVRAHDDRNHAISGKELIYPDTVRQWGKCRKRGTNIALLTSGTIEYTERFLEFPLDGLRAKEYVETILSGSEVGDKNNPETFIRIWKEFDAANPGQRKINAIFDDKLSVAKAALVAHRNITSKISSSPYNFFLVDRKGKVDEEEIRELRRQYPFFQCIRNFDELQENYGDSKNEMG